MLNKETKVIVMAGGNGTRLSPVTHDEIPKDAVQVIARGNVRGIEITARALQANRLTNVTYSANHFLDFYREALPDATKLRWQEPTIGHGTDLHDIIQEQGTDAQYLIIPTDVYYTGYDVNRLLAEHQTGTITYGVNKTSYREMEDNRVLVTDGNAVVGNTLVPYNNADAQLPRVVTSGIMVVDPVVYEEAYKRFTHQKRSTGKIDLYRDVNGFHAEHNRWRLLAGKPSQFNAVELPTKVVDYGTPERLRLIRSLITQT